MSFKKVLEFDYDNDDDITKELKAMVNSPKSKEIEDITNDLKTSGVIKNPN